MTLPITANGTDLTTIVASARILNEGGNSKRGSNFEIPNRDGEQSDPYKNYGASDLLLEVVLNTDTDGFTQLSEVQKLLAPPFGFCTLERNTPNAGIVEAVVELLADPSPSAHHYAYAFPLRCPSGTWRTKALSTASGNPPSVTTLGDRPVFDPIVTFSGPGSATHTDEAGRASILTIDAGAGAGTYIVDCGARTVKKAGVNQDRYFTTSQPWWWRFSPDALQSITSTVSITVDWRNRWAAG